MSLVFNPYSIPVIITAVFCALLALYLIKQNISLASNYLIALLFLVVLWSVAYTLELNFADNASKILARKVIYIPLSAIPVFFLYFVCRYAHPSPRKLPASTFLLLIPPAVFTVLMFTNELHGLMYTNIDIERMPDTYYTFLHPQYGIIMRISSAYSYTMTIAAMAYIIYVSVKTTRLISSQAILLFFSALMPVFINAMYYLQGFKNSFVDYTPVGLLFSGVLLTYLVTGMRQFYLRPLARDLIIRNTTEGTILLDSENHVLDINSISETIFSVKKADVLDKDCSALSGLFASFAAKNEFADELSIGKRLYSVSAVALSSDNGTHLGRMISVKDITEAKRSEKKIRELAFIDPLTKLPNHTFMVEELKELLQKRECPVAMLLIDPGKIEHINSSYGYETGDALIKKTAELIKPYTSEEDIFARMKGDEFVIIRSVSAAAGSAMFLAEQIIRTFQQPIMIHDKCISAIVNIGICTSYASEDAQSLIHKASIALGQAKKTKEHFAFYSEQNEQEITQRNKLFNALRTALVNNEFSLEYQPQYIAETDKLLGAEALLRWTNPELGNVPPSRFISLLEDSGMIIPVGNWVIEESTRQFKAWADKGIKLPKLSINLSVRQFDNDFLVPYILHTLDSKNIPRHCLEVEVTETIAVLADSSVVSKILELSRAGVRIAVDDFGSGFSSLTYFKYLKINTLKIDKEITVDIHKSLCSSAIFESLKLMCDALQVDIVAEYAETAEQVEKLISLGCANFQGYYFSKPLTPAVFERYVKSLSSDVHSDKLFGRTVVDAVP